MTDDIASQIYAEVWAAFSKSRYKICRAAPQFHYKFVERDRKLTAYTFCIILVCFHRAFATCILAFAEGVVLCGTSRFLSRRCVFDWDSRKSDFVRAFRSFRQPVANCALAFANACEFTVWGFRSCSIEIYWISGMHTGNRSMKTSRTNAKKPKSDPSLLSCDERTT